MFKPYGASLVNYNRCIQCGLNEENETNKQLILIIKDFCLRFLHVFFEWRKYNKLTTISVDYIKPDPSKRSEETMFPSWKHIVSSPNNRMLHLIQQWFLCNTSHSCEQFEKRALLQIWYLSTEDFKFQETPSARYVLFSESSVVTAQTSCYM